MLASLKNELILGQTKLHLSSVDSTNNYAANMLKVGLLKHGTVILADEQTNGRGQRGSTWQSEAGKNLQMSLFVQLGKFPVQDQRFLNSFVSVSVVKFLENMGLPARIKWPNDILVNNKKIAGILIENQLVRDTLQSAIVGIGLNVNQTKFDEIVATSIYSETNSFTAIADVLDSLLFQLNEMFEKFRTNHFAELEKIYFEKLWGFKELKKFNDKNGLFSGTISGISQDGKLLIDTAGGQRKYGIKEISFVLEELEF